MTEHMKWLKTADGIPTFEEVKGKRLAIFQNVGRVDGFSDLTENTYKMIFGNVKPDWYIIIDPPEEEPLEYKGMLPDVRNLANDWILIRWDSDDDNEHHIFEYSTKSAVITAWNQFVRSIKEKE